MQSTSTILLIRPANFGFNEQAAVTNSFMNMPTQTWPVHQQALEEFENFTECLKQNGVKVIIVDDTESPHTPDSIFPNNWFSTHSDGKLFLYPMQAENRRMERREDILEQLNKQFKITETCDLSYFESENKFLEGTGSMVLDRNNKLVYACLSPRTNLDVLHEFCSKAGYTPITFTALGQNGKAIYHTNVMMCLGDTFAIICLESIKDNEERKKVATSLESSGKEIITINYTQLNQFAGNMLQLKNHYENLLVMSEQAFNALEKYQAFLLEKHCKLVHCPLDTIESVGGGSARCMIAEIFLEPR